jgi:hypothetical protein
VGAPAVRVATAARRTATSVETRSGVGDGLKLQPVSSNSAKPMATAHLNPVILPPHASKDQTGAESVSAYSTGNDAPDSRLSPGT